MAIAPHGSSAAIAQLLLGSAAGAATELQQLLTWVRSWQAKPTLLPPPQHSPKPCAALARQLGAHNAPAAAFRYGCRSDLTNGESSFSIGFKAALAAGRTGLVYAPRMPRHDASAARRAARMGVDRRRRRPSTSVGWPALHLACSRSLQPFVSEQSSRGVAASALHA